MRILLLPLAFYVAAVAIGTRAEAQSYPWCAQYSKGDGSQNCGFVSFEQCMADVRGIGGFCNRNTQYQSPQAPHPSTSITVAFFV